MKDLNIYINENRLEDSLDKVSANENKAYKAALHIADKYKIPYNAWDCIYWGIRLGYINDIKGNKYGISKENIFDIVDETVANKETLERIIKDLEQNNLKFRFETNEEWKKEGYKDPEKDWPE